MDLSVLIIAISLSIDALGIGISYGVREIKIPLISKAIISLQSFLIMTISLFLGNIIFDLIPSYLGKYIGVIILFGMGIFMIVQPYLPKKEKVYRIKTFSLKYAGLTIKIIKSPPVCDFNLSKTIEPFEALYLGIALSIDSLGVVFGSSAVGITILLPLLAVVFQIILLSIGILWGKKVKKASNISENIWVALSGTIPVSYT
ncbi:MAG: manganese efflux pump, partial [Tyzzerella sp.]|nr:manganese efflux pump [Candidatus Fimicola merdigallinarum]